MANTNTITQNTATLERVSPIFANKILESKTIDLPGIQLVPGSRDKFAMVTGSLSNTIQPYADKPTADGTSSAIDQEFTISTWSIYHEIMYSKFVNTKWKPAIEDMKSQNLPAEFVQFLVEEQAKISAAQMENVLWNANGGLTADPVDNTPTGYVYGAGFGKIIKDKLTAASLGARIISQTTAADDPTDPTKVQAELNSILAVAPKTLIGGTGTFFVGKSVEAALWQSYATTQATNVVQDDSTLFRRHKVVVIPNLNDSRIIFGLPENLGIGTAFGTGNMVDLNIVDKYMQGDGNFAVMTANYGYGAGAVTTDWVSYEYDPEE